MTCQYRLVVVRCCCCCSRCVDVRSFIYSTRLETKQKKIRKYFCHNIPDFVVHIDIFNTLSTASVRLEEFYFCFFSALFLSSLLASFFCGLLVITETRAFVWRANKWCVCYHAPREEEKQKNAIRNQKKEGEEEEIVSCQRVNREALCREEETFKAIHFHYLLLKFQSYQCLVISSFHESTWRALKVFTRLNKNKTNAY